LVSPLVHFGVLAAASVSPIFNGCFRLIGYRFFESLSGHTCGFCFSSFFVEIKDLGTHNISQYYFHFIF
jgi:hypothetical protein